MDASEAGEAEPSGLLVSPRRVCARKSLDLHPNAGPELLLPVYKPLTRATRTPPWEGSSALTRPESRQAETLPTPLERPFSLVEAMSSRNHKVISMLPA